MKNNLFFMFRKYCSKQDKCQGCKLYEKPYCVLTEISSWTDESTKKYTKTLLDWSEKNEEVWNMRKIANAYPEFKKFKHVKYELEQINPNSFQKLQKSCFETARDNGFVLGDNILGLFGIPLEIAEAIMNFEINVSPRVKSDIDIFMRICADYESAVRSIHLVDNSILKKNNNLPEELADAVMRIFGYAEHRGIDLYQTIVAKNEHNKTRPLRHGKM